MHLIKSFMYGYLNTSDRLSRELLQKLNRMKVMKDNKDHTQKRSSKFLIKSS